MTLLGKLLFAKSVQNVELAIQTVELLVTDGGQLDLHNVLSVGHHHRDTSEKHLKILGKLLTSRITGVHCDEVSAGVDQTDWFVGVRGEDESLQTLLLGHGDRLDLSSHDGQSSERNTVELIEATPEARLAKTLENLGHVSESVLARAVRNDDKNTQGTSQILDGFSFACTGGSSGRTTIFHT